MKSVIKITIFLHIFFIVNLCFSQTSNDFTVTQNTNSLVGPDHTFTGFTKKLKNGRILQFFRLDPGDQGNHVGPNAGIAKRFSDDDGKTWSIPEIIYKDQYDDRIGSGGILDNGEIILFFGRVQCTGIWTGYYVDINYISSTDNGETWSDRHFIENTSISACFFDIFKIPGKTGYFATTYNSYYADIRYSSDGHNWDSVYTKWDYRATKELNIVEPVFTPLGNGKIIGLFRVEQKAVHQTISMDNGKTWSYPEPTNLANGYFCSYPFNVYDEKINKLITIVCDRRGNDYDMNNMNSGVWIYCNDPDSILNNAKSYSNCHVVPRGNPNIFRFMGYPYAAKTNDSTYLVLYADCYKKANNLEDADYYQFYIKLDKTIYIGKTEQSITINQTDPTPITNPFIDLVAFSSSGLPLKLESSNESIVKILNGKLIPQGIGNCNITAKQDGDATFKPAPPVMVSISVIKADQHIDIQLPPSIKVGDQIVDLQVKSSSMLPVKLKTSDSSIAYFENGKLKIVGAGMCFIIAEQDGNAIYNPISNSKTLLVKKMDQVIDFQLPPVVHIDINDIDLNEKASSKLPVSITVSDSNVAIYENGKLKIIGTGLCVVTAVQEGNDIFNASNALSKTIKVEKLDQMVDFQLPTLIKMDISEISLNELATSKLSVSINTSDSSVAMFEQGVLKIMGAGSCIVTAFQSGNNIFNPSNILIKTIKIEKLIQTVDFKLPPTLKLDISEIVLDENATSKLPVSISSSDTNVAKYESGILKIMGAGICVLTVSQDGNALYNPAKPLNKILKVEKLNQIIDFDVPQTIYVGDSNISILSSSNSNLPIEFELTDTNLLTVKNGIINALQEGICIITGVQWGNAMYNSSNVVSKKINIIKHEQSILTNIPSSLLFGETFSNITSQASSGLTIKYESSDSTIATFENGELHAMNTGFCTITASQIGNFKYIQAENVLIPFEVKRANQFISWDLQKNATYLDSDIDLYATSSSGLVVDFVSADTSIVKIVDKKLHIVGVGSTSIMAYQKGDKQYNEALPILYDFTVDKANQNIDFTTNLNLIYNSENVILQATASSLLPVSYSSSDSAIIDVISGNTLQIKKPGNCTITAIQAGNNLYNPANSIQQTIQVDKANQKLIFSSIDFIEYKDTIINPVIDVSSGLDVVFSSSNPTVIEIIDNKFHIVGTGQCTISANQFGNEYYYPSNSFSHDIIVEKAHQTIEFDTLIPIYLSNKQIDLTAKASSGLLVVFSSSDTSIAIIKNGKVIIKKTGLVIIKANQAGNNNYLAAYQVAKMLTVLRDTIPNTIPLETSLFNLYPNPANNQITINNIAGTLIRIFDLKGKILYKQDVIEDQLTIDISSFVLGMYYIQITTATNSTSLLFTKE